MSDEYFIAAAPDDRIAIKINLPFIVFSVGEDVPALFPALTLTMRLHSSTFWSSVTRIVVA